MLVKLIDFIGNKAIKLFDNVGIFSLFIFEVIKTFFTTKIKGSKLLFQMEQIGVNSFFISTITGIFAGAVLVIQTYKGFKQFGGQQFIGGVVALSMARELGPVLTGFMVAGRSSSAIAAEIGTMKITEQIDALKTLRVNPYQFLIVPRVLAGIIMLPFLTVFAILGGIMGGYFISTNVIGLNSKLFINGIKSLLTFSDIVGGLVKAATFGFILTAVGCFIGYYTTGGAKGVGISTTKSVVISFIFILITNYVLALILFGP